MNQLVVRELPFLATRADLIERSGWRGFWSKCGLCELGDQHGDERLAVHAQAERTVADLPWNVWLDARWEDKTRDEPPGTPLLNRWAAKARQRKTDLLVAPWLQPSPLDCLAMGFTVRALPLTAVLEEVLQVAVAVHAGHDVVTTGTAYWLGGLYVDSANSADLVGVPAVRAGIRAWRDLVASEKLFSTLTGGSLH